MYFEINIIELVSESENTIQETEDRLIEKGQAALIQIETAGKNTSSHNTTLHTD
ncbi:MAG TPA: hypothetical protein VKA95_02065 [Nitrososphaeraceae archaeon]|nr:hypothetical protein [Nitrososphaeraceae archaeon]